MTIDLSKLKALALAATPGRRESAEWITDDRTQKTIYANTVEISSQPNWMPISYFESQSDSDFAAAANPQVVVELIEALEKTK